jgi:hypothetical protein
LPKSNIRLNPPGLHQFFHENLAVLWSFWHTQSVQFFESDVFQILRPHSSLILNFSKYLEPESIRKIKYPPHTGIYLARTLWQWVGKLECEMNLISFSNAT